MAAIWVQLVERLMTTDANKNDDISAASRSRRLLIIALVLVHLGATVLAVQTMSVDLPGYRWPRWQCIFVEVLATGHVALLASWLSIGNAPFGIRAGASAFVVASWLMIFDYLALDHEQWSMVFALQVLAISVVLLLARLSGLRLHNSGSIREHLPTVRRNRFSLQGMLQWVAAFACVMFLITVVQKTPSAPELLGYGEFLRPPLLGLLLASVAIVAVWTTLVANQKLIPLLPLVAITIVAGLFAGKVDRLYRRSWWSTLTPETYEAAYWGLVGFYAVLVCGSLIFVRVAGFRLSKRARRRQFPLIILQ